MGQKSISWQNFNIWPIPMIMIISGPHHAFMKIIDYVFHVLLSGKNGEESHIIIYVHFWGKISHFLLGRRKTRGINPLVTETKKWRIYSRCRYKNNCTTFVEFLTAGNFGLEPNEMTFYCLGNRKKLHLVDEELSYKVENFKMATRVINQELRVNIWAILVHVQYQQ